MTWTRALLGALAALLLTNPVASANAAPDQRVRIVRYVPDQVVRLDATLGFVVTLFFGEDERIENVAVGDSLGWQITPNRRARVLFVKPNERATATNMTVVTTLRSYNFDLRAVASSRARQPLFSLRFDYPAPAKAVLATPAITPPSPPEPPQEVNKAYSFSGSSQGLPERVFDDGVSTFFVFPAGVDRKKDMFISGGENVYPAEIEAALADHPAILECAVVGVPDPRWGEVGHLVVTCREGAVLDLALILSHLEDRLARYKLPKALTLVAALPRTASGKIQKTVLRERLLAGDPRT